MNDTAQIIIAFGTAFAAVLSAIGSIISVILATKNGTKIEAVHQATNSKMDMLVHEVRTAAIAKGLLQGREEVRNGR